MGKELSREMTSVGGGQQGLYGGAQWRRNVGFREVVLRSLQSQVGKTRCGQGNPLPGLICFILQDTVLTSAGWGREKGMGWKV